MSWQSKKRGHFFSYPLINYFLPIFEKALAPPSIVLNGFGVNILLANEPNPEKPLANSLPAPLNCPPKTDLPALVAPRTVPLAKPKAWQYLLLSAPTVLSAVHVDQAV